MRWRGRWASTASGPLSLSAGFWRTPWDTATTSSGAERCSLGRETADSRNQKERCVTYELHPICWTVWYAVQQMGCVYMPKGIPQNQIKTKRPEPCAAQDPDRLGRLFLFLSNFWEVTSVRVRLFYRSLQAVARVAPTGGLRQLNTIRWPYSSGPKGSVGRKVSSGCSGRACQPMPLMRLIS